MKKILSLLTMMAVFCVVGFAQSAPKTAKKAMMLGDNAQIKDLKTGQVLKTVKAKKEIPHIYGVASGLKNGVSTPSNSTSPSNGNGFKYMKPVKEMTAPTLKVKEGTTTNPVQTTGVSATPVKNIKKMDATPVMEFKIKGTDKVQTKQLGKKQDRTVPQNAVILEKQ